MNKIIFAILALIFAIAVISLTTFLGSKEGPESTFHIKPNENTILFGITPWGEQRQIKDIYAPLLNYLGVATGKKIQLLVMENYELAVKNLLEGNIDVAVLAPVSYVKARERGPSLQYIATGIGELDGEPHTTYKGYIVALRSKYKNWKFDDFMKDPSKYKMGFVSKLSASGWAYPLAMMKKKGFDPYASFKDVIMFDNHPAVTDALRDGKIDLGATWDQNVESAAKKYGDIFQTVYVTPDIPGVGSWVGSNKVDKETVKKLRGILLDINGSSELKRKLLKNTPDQGWMVTDESFYDPVREVLKYVGDFK